MKNFLMPILNHHDHKNFEIYAFAEYLKEDLVTQEYKFYVDHWFRTDGIQDKILAQKIRDFENERANILNYLEVPQSIKGLRD